MRFKGLVDRRVHILEALYSPPDGPPADRRNHFGQLDEQVVSLVAECAQLVTDMKKSC